MKWPDRLVDVDVKMSMSTFSCAEGLKEKDKKLIMPVLSAIGLMKDQAYHLARHVWNDVHDDWPFYTDQEKQILKRYVASIKVKVAGSFC